MTCGTREKQLPQNWRNCRSGGLLRQSKDPLKGAFSTSAATPKPVAGLPQIVASGTGL